MPNKTKNLHGQKRGMPGFSGKESGERIRPMGLGEYRTFWKKQKIRYLCIKCQYLFTMEYFGL